MRETVDLQGVNLQGLGAHEALDSSLDVEARGREGTQSQLVDALRRTHIPPESCDAIEVALNRIPDQHKPFFLERLQKLVDTVAGAFPVASTVSPARCYESIRLSAMVPLKARVFDPISRTHQGDASQAIQLGALTCVHEFLLELVAASWLQNNASGFFHTSAATDALALQQPDAFVQTKLAFELPEFIPLEYIRRSLLHLAHTAPRQYGNILRNADNPLAIVKLFEELFDPHILLLFKRQYLLAFPDGNSGERVFSEPGYSLRNSRDGSSTIPRLLFDYFPLSVVMPVLTIPGVDRFQRVQPAPYVIPASNSSTGQDIADFGFTTSFGRGLVSVHRTCCSAYGTGSCYQTEASAYQALIDAGTISAALIVVEGRMHPYIARWFNGTRFGEKGKASDVTLVYALRLPSGGIYPIFLHTAEKPGAQLYLTVPNNITGQDRNILRGVEGAVRDQKFFEILHHPRYGSAESVATPVDLNLDRIRSQSEYISRCARTYAGIQRDLLNAAKAELKERQQAPGNREKPYEEEEMRELVREWAKASKKELSSAILEQITQEALQRANEIYNFEAQRAQQESDRPQLIEHRIISGYTGPSRGFALPLDKLLDDCFKCINSGRKILVYSPIRPRLQAEPSVVIAKSLKGAKHVIEVQWRHPRTNEISSRSFAEDTYVATATEALNHALTLERRSLDADMRALKGIGYAFGKLSKLGIREILVRNSEGPMSNLAIETTLGESNRRGDAPKIPYYVQSALLREFGIHGFEKVEERLKGYLISLYGSASDYNQSFGREHVLFLQKRRSDPEGALRHLEAVLEITRARAARVNEIFQLLDIPPALLFRSASVSRTAKFIFVLDGYGNPVIETEARRRSKDVSHAVLANGANIYAAGQLQFTQYATTFATFEDWLSWNRAGVQTSDTLWSVTEGDNGSGHYQPPADEISLYSSTVLQWAFHDFKTRIPQDQLPVVFPEHGIKIVDFWSRGVQVPPWDN